MSKNKLIVLEGLDGSGKSTQVQLVKDYLDGNFINYSYFHFPMYGHNQFSDIIERFLRGELGSVKSVDPYFIATQYAMDQWKFRGELLKALENGSVLLDRYVFSNMAYQGAKVDETEDAMIIRTWIYNLSFNFLQMPYPDLTIFFDVPMKIIEERLEEDRTKKVDQNREYLKGKQDIHEADIEYLTKVRKNYLDLQGYINYRPVICSDVKGIFTPFQVFVRYSNWLDKLLINQD